MFTEQRQSARKVLKTRALLALEGGVPLAGRTADIGANGVSVSVPNPLEVGQTVLLSFDLFVDGKITSIKARSRALYCVFSNGEFKVGFQFLNLELAAMTALARYLR